MLGDVKSALKNTLIYGLSNVSTKIVGLILLPLYSVHFTIDEYGILTILEVTSQILVTLFSLSLAPTFFRWYFEKKYEDKRKSLFFTLITFLLFMAILMVVPLSFATDWFSARMFKSSHFSGIIKLMLISAALEIIIIIPNVLIRLMEKPVLFTSSNMFKLAVSLTLTILFITKLNLKLDGIYKAQIIAQIAYIIFILGFILKNITPIFNRIALKEMLLFSFPLILSSIAAFAISMSDRYILTFFGTMKDVGQYSLGYKVANTIYVLIVSTVNMSLIPMLYKKMDTPDRYRFYSKVLTYYSFGLMFFVLGISFFGKEIIKVMSPNPNYWNSYIVIPFLSFAVMFMAMKEIVFLGLQITKKSKIIATLIVITSIVNFLLEIVFIYFFDTIGAAIATLISQIIYFSLVYYWAQKYYRIPYELKKVFLLFILGAVLYFCAYLCNDSSLIIRLITKSLLIIAFPIILYFFKFYEPVEIRSIKNGWIKWKNPFLWKKNILQLFNK